MIKIRFYRTLRGKCPLEECLDKLDSASTKKILWVMQFIEHSGIVPKNYLKKLVGSDGLWEIRVTCQGKSFRVLGFFERNHCLIVTHVFQKKTEQIPKRELTRAQVYRDEYLRRK